MKQNINFGVVAVKEQLINGRGLSHAYILSGPASPEKCALADWMATLYVCSGEGKEPCGTCSGCRKAAAGIHPDIIRAGGDGGHINVAAIRALRADVYIRPNEAPRKVYVLDQAQDMNPSAQNALLKTLEEGPPYAAFLLLTENDAALLPTIRSRCEILRITHTGKDVHSSEQQREAAQTLTDLLIAGNELELMTFAVSLEKWDRTSFATLLDGTMECLRDKIMADTRDIQRLFQLAEHIKMLRCACNFNIGAGHLAGWLVAGVGDK